VTGLLRTAKLLLLVLTLAAASGCATLPADATAVQKIDPFENWNRKVFSFNDALDEAILKPVATFYVDVVPQLVRTGVSNFFANFADVRTAVNNLLQGKIEEAFDDGVRVGVNSTLGLLGIFDVASEMGIDRHFEDFGQTLGVWGFDTGAYLVWPLLGSSTVRDSLALPFDYLISPAYLINDASSKWLIWGLQLVNTRAGLLGASRLIDEIALDKYTFVRDAFLQRRRSLVFDGDEPPPKEGDAPPPENEPSSEPKAPASPASQPLP